jgi:hypothetical protein
MACRMCHLEIQSTLCEVCRYLTEEAPVAIEKDAASCGHCGAPIAQPEEGETLCQLCGTIIRIVWRSRWLMRAHAEWDKENILLARSKRELLGS